MPRIPWLLLLLLTLSSRMHRRHNNNTAETYRGPGGWAYTETRSGRDESRSGSIRRRHHSQSRMASLSVSTAEEFLIFHDDSFALEASRRRHSSSDHSTNTVEKKKIYICLLYRLGDGRRPEPAVARENQ